MGAGGQIGGGHDRGKHQPVLQREGDRLGFGQTGQKRRDLSARLFHLVVRYFVILDARGQGDPVPLREFFGAGAAPRHQRKEVVGKPSRRRAEREMHFDQPVLDRPFRTLRARAGARQVQLFFLFRFHLGAKDVIGVADHGGHRQAEGGLRGRGLCAGHHPLPAPAAPARLQRDHDAAKRIRRRMVIGLRQ